MEFRSRARRRSTSRHWSAAWVPLQSITFKGVGPRGFDKYDVKFERGAIDWRILMDRNGKIILNSITSTQPARSFGSKVQGIVFDRAPADRPWALASPATKGRDSVGDVTDGDVINPGG